MEMPDQLFGNNIEEAKSPAQVAQVRPEIVTGDTPERVLFVSGDLSMASLKERAKKHNGTINDWLMGCVTMAVKQYYEDHLGRKLPQTTFRAEMAMSVHVDENL